MLALQMGSKFDLHVRRVPTKCYTREFGYVFRKSSSRDTLRKNMAQYKMDTDFW